MSAIRRLFQTQGNHETRLRNLERNLSGAGWRFDKNLQGGWGYLVANDSTDIDFGTLGLLFADASGDGALLRSTGTATVAGDVSTRLSGAAGADTVIIDSAGTKVVLALGDKLQVVDHLGNPIFEVRDDASIHGKTGAGPIQFDL